MILPLTLHYHWVGMFSSKPQAIIFLGQKGIQLIDISTGKIDSVELGEQLISKTRLEDPDRYKSLLSHLLQRSKPPSPVLLILSEDIVSEKVIEKDRGDIEEQINQFFESVSIPDGSLAKKTLEGGRIILLATNKEFYLPVVEVLSDLGVETIGVVPASIVLDRRVSSLAVEDGDLVLSQAGNIKVANLLDEEQATFSKPQKEGGLLDSGKLTVFLSLIIMALIAALWYLINYFP